ncbi:DUF298-domain-containing protein [Artomyces pyxidatus]|uniref:DUF298-domain-containing protein n=1 Tax=Artomyces pyxidatus TaxID=48021 RepID=A0ACB8STD9_9AGAM|nr:DUF298-domain-containing protein [Artomyces pyxidatus]
MSVKHETLTDRNHLVRSANEKKSGEAKGNATVLPADAPVKSGSANPKRYALRILFFVALYRLRLFYPSTTTCTGRVACCPLTIRVVGDCATAGWWCGVPGGQAVLFDDVRTVAPEPAKYEPYNAVNAATLFARYADADDPSVIDPEGFERLCTDAGIPLDGAMPLLLAWQLDAKEEMAKIPRDAWVKGSEALHISSLPVLSLALNDLHALLIMNKHTPTPSIASSTNKKKRAADTAKSPYNRTRYSGYAADVKKTFASFYSFCFVLAKPESSRNIDMETAIALWSVILSPQYPLISDVITYINEAGTYKAVNKDLWAMMLEFCQTVQPDLQHYEADGAWPSLIDDFVTWKKARGGASASAVEQPVDIE